MPRSLLGTEQSNTLQLPVGPSIHAILLLIALVRLFGGLGSKPDSGNQVPIVTLRVLVDGAGVVSLAGT